MFTEQDHAKAVGLFTKQEQNRNQRRARNEQQAQTVRADQRGGWGGCASDCRSTWHNHNNQQKCEQQARNDLRTARRLG